jgi:hypothetical protein
MCQAAELTACYQASLLAVEFTWILIQILKILNIHLRSGCFFIFYRMTRVLRYLF